MPNVNNSPNMNLPVPAVSLEPGPQWASDLNASLTILDGHNHAPGSGVQINPAGLNINTSLPFNNNPATTLQAAVFTPQSSLSALTAIYVIGNELYYNDGAGNNVKITNNGSVAGATGSISGLTPPASASYAGSTFVFQSNVLTAANIDVASVLLRNTTASSNALTLNPPNTMGSNYSLTLPSIPGSTLPLVIDTSGNMSGAQITLAQLVASVQAALNPSGVILPFGGTVVPTGYLLCDGSAVSRTTFSNLFTAISSSFGPGDGSTTFNVPDLRGLFLRGVAGSSGRDPDVSSRSALLAGGATGNNVGSYQADAFASHTHAFTMFGGQLGPIGIPPNGSGTTGNSGATLANGGAETRPINVYVNYIIKT